MSSKNIHNILGLIVSKRPLATLLGGNLNFLEQRLGRLVLFSIFYQTL